jgi:hypothetical protein
MMICLLAPFRMKVYFALALAWTLLLGCRATERAGTPTTTRPTTLSEGHSAPDGGKKLRQCWTHALAASVSGQLGARYYDDYKASLGTEKRGPAFSRLVRRLETSPLITGLQCLEILGPPDYWKLTADGESALIYFYTEDAGVHEDEYLICFNSSGVLYKVGWNGRSSNFNGWSKWEAK